MLIVRRCQPNVNGDWEPDVTRTRLAIADLYGSPTYHAKSRTLDDADATR